MELQAVAERNKRARILQSEGERQASINIAEGKMIATVLASEAAIIDLSNRGRGKAVAIEKKAKATADGIGVVAAQLCRDGSTEAAGYRIAEKYVEALGREYCFPSLECSGSSSEALAWHQKINPILSSSSHFMHMTVYITKVLNHSLMCFFIQRLC
ncbi:unnamed protein product [Cuscuta campestris]|uniref:Uncharacterized protein n=1 Tax=Cuscuta campestris TaxID=132261 RepID=A0A484LGZ4_9ASTE|nr:unnamed protein product [Cuscuta campestris]